MSFLRTARAVLDGPKCLGGIAFALLLLTGFLVSCGGSGKLPTFGTAHNAYVTLPTSGSVLQLHIDGLTGAVTTAAQTPRVLGTSPTGLALLSKKFLYVANAGANTISVFNVASDGTLSLSGTPTPAGGSTPYAATIDPTGKYLLVTNSSLSDSISVFSIDSGSGALTPVPGSPFFANDTPSEILITPNSNLVYVTNPRIGSVTAFTFSTSTGALTQVPGSPFASGSGASGLTADGSGQHLYVANTSALNPASTTVGNISGFNINTTTGVLTPIPGSPFTSAVGSGPGPLVLDPSGRFLFATTPGGNYSVWVFSIGNGGQLTAVGSSPYSVPAGGLFALIDPRGNFFYIGSQSANGIAGYTYDQNNGQPTLITHSPFSTGTAPGKMVIAD
jgi:6-phosphogluconolactonase